MIFFIWKEEYLTNISELDSQHQKLVLLINNLYADLVKCQDVSQKQAFVVNALKELIDYGCYHFEAEEKLMLKYGYSGYAHHKEEHERFKLQIAQFLKEQSEGSRILSFPVLVFVKDWLVSHVIETDKQYGPYLSARI